MEIDMEKKEYIFRGIPVNKNEETIFNYVYGSLDFSDKLNPKIIVDTNTSVNVIENSINQCTCYKDRNGNRIFENDVLEFVGLGGNTYKGTVIYFMGSYQIVVNDFAYYSLYDYYRNVEIVND